MSDLRVNNITNSGGGTGPVIAGVSTVSSTAFMIMPTGNTEVRGAGSGRGVFCGGFYGAAPSPGNVDDSMDYVEIATTGNAIDFGDMAYNAAQQGSVSSSTRGVTAGGISPSNTTTKMQYVTISSQGGGNNFGDLSLTRKHPAAASNNTRGIIAGGQGTSQSFNIIEHITIATTGDAQGFGDLQQPRWFAGGGRASTTRMVFMGGVTQDIAPWAGGGGQLEVEMIDYVEIATKGNSIDFGNLINGLKGYGMGCGNVSSTTRTVSMGGFYNPADRNEIQYITFATLGNATDFGDLLATTRGGGSTSSQTRGLLSGGRTPTQVNTIQYITIATTGDTIDFGDSTRIVAFNNAGLSDAHGGLG